MNENLDAHNEKHTNTDKDYEKALRPIEFNDFSGQEAVVDNLRVFVLAAKQREEALDHVLLHGPPGLGKTTLAHIISNDLGVKLDSDTLGKRGRLQNILRTIETVKSELKKIV